MNDRIHRALDGELNPAGLTPDEQAEFERLSEAIRTATGEYRTIAAPDMTASVMDRIRRVHHAGPAPGAAGGSRLFDWLWRPRPVMVAWRPAYAVLALFLATLGLWGGLRTSPLASTDRSPAPSGAVETQPAIYVQFRLDMPGASTVRVVGSFTDWTGTVELVETVPGVWSAMVPLEPGVHDYTFLVDDDLWVVDPLAPTIEDGFGGSKNRLFLTRPSDNA